jgi:hypothetical protein
MRVDEMSELRRRALDALAVEARWAGDFDGDAMQPAEPPFLNHYYIDTDALDEAGVKSELEPMVDARR